MSEAQFISGLARPDTVIDPTVISIVRIHTARLAGRFGFTRADREDIEQELLLDCFVRLQRHNPAKSSRCTFLDRVARYRVSNLRQYQSAACRDYRLCMESGFCGGFEPLRRMCSYSRSHLR
jgi:hypothetical protein